MSTIRGDRLRQEYNIFNLEKGSDIKPVGTLEIARNELVYWVHFIGKHEAAIDTFMLQVKAPVLSLAYEDLLDNRNKVLSEIYDYLGISQEEIEDQYEKHTPDDLRHIVANYDEVIDLMGRIRNGVVPF